MIEEKSYQHQQAIYNFLQDQYLELNNILFQYQQDHHLNEIQEAVSQAKSLVDELYQHHPSSLARISTQGELIDLIHYIEIAEKTYREHSLPITLTDHYSIMKYAKDNLSESDYRSLEIDLCLSPPSQDLKDYVAPIYLSPFSLN